MPVGTHGAVKAMTPDQVRATGAEVVLANTYHLTLRPGEALVQKLGGLHAFMRWDGPILTDSGGFQVFSLPNREIGDGGVRFKNEIDGSSVELTPERSVEIQNALGADIIMAFDECTPHPADEALARTGVRRTLSWLDRCLKAHRRSHDQALFGIVQGSVYPALRASCAEAAVALDLPGYAIGGVSVGEGHELLCEITAHTAPLLPENKPRYLMGVGLPEDLLAAIGCGIDLFDCVIPTRYARSATLFTVRGRIRLTHRRYRRDAYPIDVSCDCVACAGGFSRAYLHHPPPTRSSPPSWPRSTTCASTSGSWRTPAPPSPLATSRPSARISWRPTAPRAATGAEHRSHRGDLDDRAAAPGRRRERSHNRPSSKRFSADRR
jgi:queuine tRNA-ribosyltransferase